jgi:soluble lytic murein transglycosylase
MMKLLPIVAIAFVNAAASAQNAPDPLAPLPVPTQQPATAAPAPVTQSVQPSAPVVSPRPTQIVQIPRDWRGVFSAIRRGEWGAASAGIASLPDSPLKPLAKAELYTAKGSPVVPLELIERLLVEAPELPQAHQLARMAIKRGALTPPLIVPRKRLISLPTPPTRYRARPVAGDAYADQLRPQLEPYVKANDAANAEALLNQTGAYMGYDARAELGQRVAWIYYVLGDDLNARRVADTWRPGATGEWGSQAAWISALASWRLNDCEAASRSFREVAATAVQRELKAGGYYWAARAEQACRRPRSVAPLLKQAAVSPESFYGLLARETLGLDTRLPSAPPQATAAVENLPNIRRAVDLLYMGEHGLAEQLLRHQAAIGNPQDHRALIEIAKKYDLAAMQWWLATNGPSGAVAHPSDRYPNPKWAPVTGWRVDPALAYGHIIQESTFQTDAVSHAGAVGLMQVIPGTAADEARARGIAYSRASLTDPKYNLEYGQSFIERMRRSQNTGGQLPKVIASYNAGATPLGRWASINDKGDPLLWMESLSYWETRYYVPAVLRNMWVYQGLNKAPTPTLKAMAQHHWPAFPTGQTTLRH